MQQMLPALSGITTHAIKALATAWPVGAQLLQTEDE
jgi:hypothetical protein